MRTGLEKDCMNKALDCAKVCSPASTLIQVPGIHTFPSLAQFCICTAEFRFEKLGL